MADTNTQAVQEEKFTKIEGVRRALADLGKNAKSKDIQAYVKKHFDFDMTLGHAKNAKSKVLQQDSKKKGRKKAAPIKAASPAPPAPPPVAAKPAAKQGNGQTIPLADIVTVRKLVERMGTKELQTLIEVMSR